MTVEQSIFDALKSLVSNRVFPDAAPFSTARPFITYQQIGGEAVSFLESGLPNKKHGDFRIYVWADTRASCAATALLVESAMASCTSFQATARNAPHSLMEDEVNICGSLQTFSVWSDR